MYKGIVECFSIIFNEIEVKIQLFIAVKFNNRIRKIPSFFIKLNGFDFLIKDLIGENYLNRK